MAAHEISPATMVAPIAMRTSAKKDDDILRSPRPSRRIFQGGFTYFPPHGRLADDDFAGARLSGQPPLRQISHGCAAAARRRRRAASRPGRALLAVGAAILRWLFAG